MSVHHTINPRLRLVARSTMCSHDPHARLSRTPRPSREVQPSCVAVAFQLQVQHPWLIVRTLGRLTHKPLQTAKKKCCTICLTGGTGELKFRRKFGLDYQVLPALSVVLTLRTIPLVYSPCMLFTCMSKQPRELASKGVWPV